MELKALAVSDPTLGCSFLKGQEPQTLARGIWASPRGKGEDEHSSAAVPSPGTKAAQITQREVSTGNQGGVVGMWSLPSMLVLLEHSLDFSDLRGQLRRQDEVPTWPGLLTPGSCIYFIPTR